MRKISRYTVITALLVIVSVVSIALGETYGVYYASTASQNTAFVIMNSGGIDTYYTIKLYDPYGSLLEAETGDLTGYESDYHVISDIVSPGDSTWGLAIIETPGLLTIGIETFLNEQWYSSDNVVDAVSESGEHTYYWYGLNYSSTSNQTTGIAVANPNSKPAAATVFLFDSFGNQQKSLDLVLEPYETDYYDSTKLVGISDSMWGIVDIKATVPIIAAAEYFNADRYLLNVDQITHNYYSE